MTTRRSFLHKVAAALGLAVGLPLLQLTEFGGGAEGKVLSKPIRVDRIRRATHVGKMEHSQQVFSEGSPAGHLDRLEGCIDFASGESTTVIQHWQKNPDGTWTKIQLSPLFAGGDLQWDNVYIREISEIPPLNREEAFEFLTPTRKSS